MFSALEIVQYMKNNLDIYQTNFASPFGLHYIIKVPLYTQLIFINLIHCNLSFISSI